MGNKKRNSLKEFYALLLVMGSFLILIVEVVFRYLLGGSLEWTDEISRVLLVWMTFTGMGFVIRDKKEIVCEAFGQKLSGRIRKCWSRGLDVVGGAFLVFLLFFGIKMTLFSWDIKTESLELPFSLFYVSIPIGCVLMLSFLAKRIWQERTEGEKEEA